MKKHAPATLRNRTFILEVMTPLLADRRRVLEIASGSGEHAVFFAERLPDVAWQPTDPDAESLASIEAHRAESGLTNLKSAVRLDVTEEPWPALSADAIVCINMIHIAPWEATIALFRGAARVLGPGAPLYLYGPYRFAGAFTAESNEAFDASLRARDSRWGVRDLDEVTAVAEESGFSRVDVVAMPANNHSVLFRRA